MAAPIKRGVQVSQLGESTGVTGTQSGFSLLEMVVAVAILGMTLGVLYQAASGATRTLAVDEKMAYAVELARSLRDLYAVVPLEGASASGETAGGFNWQVSTAAISLPDASPLNDGQLHSLFVEVSWEDGRRDRSFELESVVTGREEQAL